MQTETPYCKTCQVLLYQAECNFHARNSTSVLFVTALFHMSLQAVQHSNAVCNRLFTGENTEYVLVCTNKICCMCSSINAKLKLITKTSNNCVLYLESVISQYKGIAVWHTMEYLITRGKYLER